MVGVGEFAFDVFVDMGNGIEFPFALLVFICV